MAAPAILSGDGFGSAFWAVRSSAAKRPRQRGLHGWRDWPSHPERCPLVSGENRSRPSHPAVPSKLRDALAIGLFIVLAGYVTFSGMRLGLLLWQRFS